MEFLKLITERRSVRKYEGTIPHEDLTAILMAAQQAPSWKNQQTSRCYAAETPEILEDLRASALPSFNRNSSANATLVVTTFVRDIVGFNEGEPANEIGNGWGAYDLGLHDAYLVLAAKDMGYDTLIMGLRDAERIREELHIPANEEIMSVIAIGKGGETPAPRPRKEMSEVNKFI